MAGSVRTRKCVVRTEGSVGGLRQRELIQAEEYRLLEVTVEKVVDIPQAVL